MSEKGEREADSDAAASAALPAVPAERALSLAQSEQLDLSGLNEDQVALIKRQHADGMVALQVKAAEMKLDVSALDAALTSFTDQTAKASQAGAHATIQHSQTSALGRTEVVIGNTERAAAGRFSNIKDLFGRYILWIVGAVAVVVILATTVMGR